MFVDVLCLLDDPAWVVVEEKDDQGKVVKPPPITTYPVLIRMNTSRKKRVALLLAPLHHQ